MQLNAFPTALYIPCSSINQLYTSPAALCIPCLIQVLTNTGGSVRRQVVARQTDTAEATLQVHAFPVQTDASDLFTLIHI